MMLISLSETVRECAAFVAAESGCGTVFIVPGYRFELTLSITGRIESVCCLAGMEGSPAMLMVHASH